MACHHFMTVHGNMYGIYDMEVWHENITWEMKSMILYMKMNHDKLVRQADEAQISW